jgi:o-succinylbenzoate synthase
VQDDPDDDTATLRLGWDALGTAVPLVLEGAELIEVELPFAAPIATAVGTHRSRPLVLVKLRCRRPVDGATVVGWGECAALSDTTYDNEDVAVAWATLESVLLPDLIRSARELGGLLPSVGSLRRLAGLAPDRPLSFAALEVAVADAHLRAAGMSLGDLLGVAGAAVRPGAVVGSSTSTEALLAAVGALASQGYVRVKAKIDPDNALATVNALARWAGTQAGQVPRFQVDANGFFRAGQVEQVAALDPFGLVCIEQPFARDDLASHRRLAKMIDTPVCLDESLAGVDSVIGAVTSGACSVVCIKPARLGGIGEALDVVAWCTAHGVPWWLGGMFESGMGRRVTTALAALPGPVLPGDLAPPATYLAADLVAPVASRTDPRTGWLTVDVDQGPGTGPLPEEEAIESHRIRGVALLPIGT